MSASSCAARRAELPRSRLTPRPAVSDAASGEGVDAPGSGSGADARADASRPSCSAALITLVFTAANVYLGLKVGLTFATSIPAAVISMAVLRLFANSTILENNIVQTIASAAGTLAAIIFVLPGPGHDRLVERLSLLDDGRGRPRSAACWA